MADDSYRRYYPPAPETAQRPPDAYPATMAASVTLPSIHDPRSPDPPPAAPAQGYPGDPRYASPNAVNGYPPPGGQQPPPGQQQQPYLPPLQPYRQPPPNDHQNYRSFAGGVYKYPQVGPGNPPQLAQAGLRQRTSIACRYCRKRKIRCSGYESAPGGKCQNCARINQECIFQPVSSSISTAFIPVSAVPGGVPPGTQLFGAYGQPLAPGTIPPGPPPPTYQQHPDAPPLANYYALVRSPAESYPSYGDARPDDGSQVAGRCRRRILEEQGESCRLPPCSTLDPMAALPRGRMPPVVRRPRLSLDQANNQINEFGYKRPYI